MKKWFEKHLGVSWKTTLIGYVAAAFTAIYPLMDQDVDFSNNISVKRYIVKLFIAAGIALMGKYAADSAQVKDVHNEVKKMKNE